MYVKLDFEIELEVITGTYFQRLSHCSSINILHNR